MYRDHLLTFQDIMSECVTEDFDIREENKPLIFKLHYFYRIICKTCMMLTEWQILKFYIFEKSISSLRYMDFSTTIFILFRKSLKHSTVK